MTVKALLRYAQGRLWLVLVALIVGGAAGALIVALAPKRFDATAVLYVGSPASENAGVAYQAGLLSRERVKSYAELTTSPAVAQFVANATQQLITPEQVAGDVSAATANDSTVLNINASADTAAGAAQLANLSAVGLTGLVTSLEKPQDPRLTPTVGIKIIQAASIPTNASNLGPIAGFSLGASVGLICSVGTLLLLYVTNRRVRTKDDFHRLRKSYPDLGSTSQFESDKSVDSNGNRDDDKQKLLGLKGEYQSIAAMVLAAALPATRVIMVSSTQQSEGKTTTALSLGRVFAESGRRTLLIEGDLRRPALSAGLGLDSTVGVTTIASGSSTLKNSIQQIGGPYLSVLSAGRLPPNPSEILSSSQMQQILHEARQLFDLILVDTPPAGPVSDAVELASECDEVIIAVRPGWSRRTDIQTSIEKFERTGTRITGLLFSLAREHRRIPSVDSKATGIVDNSTRPVAETADTVQLRPTPFRREQ